MAEASHNPVFCVLCFFFLKNPDWGINNHLKLCWLLQRESMVSPFHFISQFTSHAGSDLTSWSEEISQWWGKLELLLQSTIWIRFSVYSLSYVCIILVHQKRQTKSHRITASSLTSDLWLLLGSPQLCLDMGPAGVQPWWIQGIWSRDGVSILGKNYLIRDIKRD